MKTKVFSVYDSKALVFGVPFFMPSVGAAVRAFSDLSNDVNTVINRHPEDYLLYQVGEFDDEKAELSSIRPIVLLGNGRDFISVVPKPSNTSSIVDAVISNGSEREVVK